MQLRVPKRYQPNRRRRRRLFSRRFLFLLFLTMFMCGLGYIIQRDPDSFRAGASDVADKAREQIDIAQDRMFPVEPTATPDVRPDVVACDNAYQVGDWEAVIDACSRALPGRPNDVELHYRVAMTLVITSGQGADVERMNAALDVAHRTINANPESAWGWVVQGMTQDWTLQYTAALTSIQRALELNPASIIAKAHLANIYRNLGQKELARTTIEDALLDVQTVGADNETRAVVYRNYGRYLSGFDADFESALEYYQLARQAMPGYTYITIEMATVYIALGNNTAAFELLEDVLTTAPRDVEVLYFLGELYRGQGEGIRATEMFSRCLDVNPDYGPCLSRLGWVYYFSPEPRYDLAIENLSRATQLGSTHPYDWYLLGRSYFRIDQCNLAATPLNEGYRLRQQQPEVSQVGLSDFVAAFTECNLPEPQN